ncbi:hypothetical protein [Isoptericola sp. NPDC055881]
MIGICRRTRLVGVLATGAVAAMAGCTAPAPAPAPTTAVSGTARFATAAIDVVGEDGVGIDLNLLFVADPEDPVWDATGVTAGTRHVDDFDMLRGTQGHVEGVGERRLGNLTFNVDAHDSLVEFSTITLTVDGAEQTFDVGQVRVYPNRETDGPFEVTGEATVTAPSCGTFTQKFEAHEKAGRAPIVRALNASDYVDVSAEATTSRRLLTTRVSVRCDPAADFVMVTPMIEVDTDGERALLPTTTVTIGYNPTPETIEKIASRPGQGP